MKKRVIIFKIYALVFLIILGIKFYYDYVSDEDLKRRIISSESKSLTALLISFMQTYQKAFTKNHILIDNSTINLFPVKIIKNIAEDFSLKLKQKIIIRTVSDRPRNKANMANKDELEIISYFKKNPTAEFFYKNLDSAFYSFTPLYIKTSCLKCHGKREDAISTVLDNYDSAYNYKLGDLRGIISIKMFKKNTLSIIDNNFKKSLLMACIIYLFLLLIGWSMIKLIIKNEIKFSENLKIRIDEKTQKLNRLNKILLSRNKELKIAELKAKESTKLKSEFLANMSHEIRTPMNAILGFSEILESKLTKHENKSYLNKITLSGKNLINLINDILDISKIEAGQLKITKEFTDLHEVINIIPKIFFVLSHKKNIPINVNISKLAPRYILSDGYRLNQILVNLVGNSIKFTNTGNINIILDVKKTYNKKNEDFVDILIKVKDTGIGIPKNQLDNIFETFQQVKGQKSREYGGTGLGLAITKKLVELLNGKIYVQSEVGKGTTFTIFLEKIKVLSEKRSNKIAIKDNKSTLNIKKVKILHVEDVEMNREIITLFSRNNNITIKDAVNGKEALDILKRYTPDIILMDIQMPELNGYDATKIIRKNKNLKHIPIIAITANATNEEKKKYGHIFDEYLTKPITNKTFLSAINKFTNQ